MAGKVSRALQDAGAAGVFHPQRTRGGQAYRVTSDAWRVVTRSQVILVFVLLWVSGFTAGVGVFLFSVGLHKNAAACACSSAFSAIIANQIYEKVRGN